MSELISSRHIRLRETGDPEVAQPGDEGRSSENDLGRQFRRIPDAEEVEFFTVGKTVVLYALCSVEGVKYAMSHPSLICL